MNLREVLKGIDYELIKGDVNKEVLDIQYNSMNVKEDSLFVAIEGYSTDGHKYIKSAIEKGAKIIVCSKDIEEINGNYTLLKVGDGRKALATISSNYYGNPKDKLKIIGVTGTNGKTTTTFMIKSILEEAGYKVGLLGTISNYIGNKRVPAERTTPESLEMHMLFKDMVEEGVEYCVMEVSSHSLYLDRVHGIEFEEGIFTNLTQDHLDFHETFDNYYKAKFILFQNSKKSIINIDDEYGMKLLKDINNDFFTYSTKEPSNLCAYNIQMHPRGIKFTVDYENEKEEIDIHIPGRYNISNALGAILACLNEGISLNLAKKGLENLSGVPGRCEIVTKDYELGYDVIVDYAHTPDGLDNILKTAREFTKGRLISIFGCGGDRDKTKRPIMGSIGTELSDISIITSDNPRTEDPLMIIEDILSGIKKENFIVEENRREAIKKAMEMAREGDVIVLAGKGHEDYQILKDKTIHFDEREVVKEIIDELYAK